MLANRIANSKPIEFDGFSYSRFAIIKGVEFDSLGNSNVTEIGKFNSIEFDALKNNCNDKK
jgi:hypothetical protein